MAATAANHSAASSQAADSRERFGVAVPEPRGPRLDGGTVELSDLEGIECLLRLPEIPVGAASNQQQLGAGGGRHLRDGCLLEQFERLGRTPERALAIGHDGEVVREAAHPAMRAQLRQRLGVLTGGIRGETGSLTHRRHPRGDPAGGSGVSEGGRRIRLEQLAGGYELACDGLSSGFGQAAQLALDGGIDLIGGDAGGSSGTTTRTGAGRSERGRPGPVSRAPSRGPLRRGRSEGEDCGRGRPEPPERAGRSSPMPAGRCWWAGRDGRRGPAGRYESDGQYGRDGRDGRRRAGWRRSARDDRYGQAAARALNGGRRLRDAAAIRELPVRSPSDRRPDVDVGLPERRS